MSHRTVRKPTDEERDQLKQMKRQEVGRVAMRAHMILLSDRGYSPSKIADLHDVSHPTVYKWIDRFDKEGPGGLYDREWGMSSQDRRGSAGRGRARESD